MDGVLLIGSVSVPESLVAASLVGDSLSLVSPKCRSTVNLHQLNTASVSELSESTARIVDLMAQLAKLVDAVKQDFVAYSKSLKQLHAIIKSSNDPQPFDLLFEFYATCATTPLVSNVLDKLKAFMKRVNIPNTLNTIKRNGIKCVILASKIYKTLPSAHAKSLIDSLMIITNHKLVQSTTEFYTWVSDALKYIHQAADPPVCNGELIQEFLYAENNFQIDVLAADFSGIQKDVDAFLDSRMVLDIDLISLSLPDAEKYCLFNDSLMLFSHGKCLLYPTLRYFE